MAAAGGLCGCLSSPFNKGMLFVMTTAIIWVLASFVVQDIDEDLGAFTLTYIANSMFSLYLPITAFCTWWQARNRMSSNVNSNSNGINSSTHQQSLVMSPREDIPSAGDEHPGDDSADADAETARLVQQTSGQQQQQAPSAAPSVAAASGTQQKRAVHAALVVAPLWFMAQLTFNEALSLTTVTSNTVLSSASSMFTFLGSVLFLGEKYKSHKLISVMLCMAGTICVGLADHGVSSDAAAAAAAPRSGPGGGIGSGDAAASLDALPSAAAAVGGNVMGDLLTLASSGFYAAYTLAISYYIAEDEALGMSRFFGFMGLCIMVAMAPVLVILQLNGSVQLQDVKTVTYEWTLIKGLFDNVLTDYLWARAVVLLGPTVATLGLSMQIPVALALDLMLGRSTFTRSPRALALNMLSVVFVVAGFVGINMNEIAWLDHAASNAMRRLGLLSSSCPPSLRE